MKQLAAACLLLLLAALPARAADWVTHTDDTYGFTIEVPADYRRDPLGAIQRFISPDGRIEIAVFAGRLFEPFETMMSEEIARLAGRDWQIDGAQTTPDAAGFTMRRSGFVQVSQVVVICPEGSFARVDIGYGEADTARLLPLTAHVVGSLRPTGTVACPR